MRILYHHRIGSKDGQYVHVEELTRALRRSGHEIFMAAPERTESASFGADSGMIGRLKRWMPAAIYEGMEYAYSYSAYRRLARLAREHRPAGLYERYSLFLPSGVRLKRAIGIPMILEVNAPLYEERSRYGGIALSRLARRTEVETWRGADAVVPVTQVLADHVRRAGVPEDRIVVIPNGIDPERFGRMPDRERAKSALGLDGRVVLGFTGFVREWHRLDRAIDALGRGDVPASVHLLVVGDGPVRDALTRHAAERGVSDRVTFTGIIDRDAIVDHVAAFDIALQPAVVPYASPLKLFEYLACGAAVIAPDTPNIREILTHERDALLFGERDEGEFERWIGRLVGDPGLRERLGTAGRSLIAERGLTWDRNAERVVDLFRRLGAGGN